MTPPRVLPVPIPPISLLREFARRVSVVEKLKAAPRAALVELNALFAPIRFRLLKEDL